jgi:hypothetical protein
MTSVLEARAAENEVRLELFRTFICAFGSKSSTTCTVTFSPINILSVKTGWNELE